MTIALASAMDSLLCAKSPARMSDVLGNILTELRNYDRVDWPKKIQEIKSVFSRISSYRIARVKQERASVAVLSPEDATLAYISQELDLAADATVFEEQLERMQGLLYKCDQTLVASSAQTAAKALCFLERQYKIFSSCGTYCVMAIPFVDLRCVAECEASEYNIMYLNATRDSNLLKTMAFEFASAIMASDDPPLEAVQLLLKTFGPKYRKMRREDKYARLMDGLDAGLAYGSQYAYLFDLPEELAKEWHKYIVDMLASNSHE